MQQPNQQLRIPVVYLFLSLYIFKTKFLYAIRPFFLSIFVRDGHYTHPCVSVLIVINCKVEYKHLDMCTQSTHCFSSLAKSTFKLTNQWLLTSNKMSRRPKKNQIFRHDICLFFCLSFYLSYSPSHFFNFLFFIFFAQG